MLPTNQYIQISELSLVCNWKSAPNIWETIYNWLHVMSNRLALPNIAAVGLNPGEIKLSIMLFTDECWILIKTMVINKYGRCWGGNYVAVWTNWRLQHILVKKLATGKQIWSSVASLVGYYRQYLSSSLGRLNHSQDFTLMDDDYAILHPADLLTTFPQEANVPFIKWPALLLDRPLGSS